MIMRMRYLKLYLNTMMFFLPSAKKRTFSKLELKRVDTKATNILPVTFMVMLMFIKQDNINEQNNINENKINEEL